MHSITIPRRKSDGWGISFLINSVKIIHLDTDHIFVITSINNLSVSFKSIVVTVSRQLTFRAVSNTIYVLVVLMIKEIFTMKSDDFNKSEQILKLRSKIVKAENSRLSGEPTVSLEEARTRLNEKYNTEILDGNN